MAPVAYDRTQLPYVEAMQAVDLAGVTRRAEADAALAARVPDPGVRAFLLQSLALGPDGAEWKLNLAALGAEMPKIMGLPDLPAAFDGPTLFLFGAASDYVGPAHWPRIRALFPAARARRSPAPATGSTPTPRPPSSPPSRPSSPTGRLTTGRRRAALLKGARAAVAQLVEHVIRNDGVGGSSPFCGTTLLFAGVRGQAVLSSNTGRA